MMKRLFLLSIIASLGLGMWAQQTKVLTAEKHNEYGLIYTLPSTAFRIDIIAVKEIRVAGPFSNYSKIFTADKKVISENKVNWKIESVSITPYGVPDRENEYLMQLKAGSPTYLCVAADGMLLAVNKEVELPATIENKFVEIEGTPVSGKEYLEFVNEDFTSAQSSYKQAQLLAEELMEIRESKISLTRGTAETMPTDGRQLEIMLASLEKQEKALTNAFTGSSWKERVKATYTFLPEEEGKSVLCRLNFDKGFVDAEDLSGEPIYISVSDILEAELPVDAKGEEKKLPKDAVVYCIPGNARLSVSYQGSDIYSRNFEMSQFGMTFGLNPSIFTDKKEPSFAIFDPATGALKELGTLK